MIIFYACSKEYEKYLKISIESVLKHNPSAEINIMIDEPLDLPYKQIKFNQEHRIKHKDALPAKYANMKLFLPELNYDKVIYLGADTICQSSLKEMWNMPCKYINACKSHKYGDTQAEEIGIGNYVNIDSMVLNLKAMREDNFTEKVLNQTKFDLSIWCNEETVINKVCHEKIKLLPQKFNYAYNREYDNPMQYSEAVILHFIGRQKEAMCERAEQ